MNRTVQYIEQSVNNVIMLKTFVSGIKKIYQALGAAQSDLLLTIRKVLFLNHFKRHLVDSL